MSSRNLSAVNLNNREKYSYKTLYHIVFCLFKVSGLCATKEISRFCRPTSLNPLHLLNVPLFILHIFFNYCMMHRSVIPMAVANVSMTIVSGVLRVSLIIKLSRLRKLAQQINIMYVKDNCRDNLCWMYLWVVFSTLTLIPLAVNSLLTIIAHPVFDLFAEKVIRNAVASIFAITLILFFILPVNTVVIYYTSICKQLRSIAMAFEETIKPPFKADYQQLHRRLLAVKWIVKETDKRISSYALFTVVYNFFMMYFAVAMVTHPEASGDGIQQSTIYLICINGFVGFLTMTMSASSVHEQFSSVADRVEMLTENSRPSTSTELRFFRSVDRQPTLTVWGIAPMKRSFMFGAFGTFLTYCILFLTLSEKPN